MRERQLRQVIREEIQRLDEGYVKPLRNLIQKLDKASDARSSSRAGLDYVTLANKFTATVERAAKMAPKHGDAKEIIDLLKNNLDVKGVTRGAIGLFKSGLKLNKKARKFKSLTKNEPNWTTQRFDDRILLMYRRREPRDDYPSQNMLGEPIKDPVAEERYFIYKLQGGEQKVLEKEGKPRAQPGFNRKRTIRTFDIRSTNPESVLKYLKSVVN
jgi:hypothetical protein